MNSDLKKALDSMPGAKQTTISESMTSAGRLDKMLASNSPLMKRAQTQGLQQAQSRGLLNSSMAAGASQGAMIDRAQPFAMQDSNNLISTAQRNTDAQNQRGLLQAGLIGDSYKSNQNYEQQLGLNEQAYGFEGKLAEQHQGYQQDNLKLSDTLQQQQMKLQNALEQGNMQLANQLQKDINVQQNEFEKGLLNQQAGLQQTRDERLSGYDKEMQRLSAELDEARAQQDFGREKELLNQQAGLQQSRDERLSGYDKEMQRLNAELDEARAQQNFGREKELLNQQADITSQRDRALFDQQVELQAQQYGLQSDILKQETDAAMEKLFGSSMANAWGAMGNNITSTVARSLDAVNRIQLDPNISADNKTQLIEQIASMRDADINFQKNLFETLPSQLKNTGVFPPIGTAGSSGTFNQSRLNEIYQQRLGKNIDQAGADYWRSQFDTLGWDGIEWNIKQQAGSQGGSPPASQSASRPSSASSSSTQSVSRGDVLGAMQAAGGLVDSNAANQWVQRINSGQATMADLQASLRSGQPARQQASAPAANNQRAPNPNQARLNQIYQQLMGRDADQAGADYWLSQLDTLGWDGIEWNIRQGMK